MQEELNLNENDKPELRKLVEDYLQQRAVVEEIEDKLKSENEKLVELQTNLLNHMEACDMTSFDTKDKKISRVVKNSYKQPADRDAFFNYLKERGDFDGLVSVNSQTLNRYLKDKAEAAESSGEFFELPPGIMPPSSYSIISVRKK